jgi:hypothetical protein
MGADRKLLFFVIILYTDLQITSFLFYVKNAGKIARLFKKK